MKENTFRIVGDDENGYKVEIIDEIAGDCVWTTIVYTCERKGKEGFKEAKQWIKEQEKQQ